MSDKITWWPAKKEILESIPHRIIVLMRYDWPDGKRFYDVGTYTPGRPGKWATSGDIETTAPDFFVTMDQVVQFIDIPADREFTYKGAK